MQSKKTVSDVEAAEYIGMSVSFLRQARCNGNREGRTAGPPFIKIGRSIRYLITDLEIWLLEHRQIPKA